jgi:hypothetical protein
VWMTGTDESLFSAAKNRAQFWTVRNAGVEKI